MTSNNTFREWVLLKEAKGMLKENLDKVYDNYLKPMLNGIIEKSNNEPKFLTKPQKAEILSLAGHTEMPESFYNHFKDVELTTSFGNKYTTQALSKFEEKAWRDLVKNGDKWVFDEYKKFNDYLEYLDSQKRDTYGGVINDLWSMIKYIFISKMNGIIRNIKRQESSMATGFQTPEMDDSPLEAGLGIAASEIKHRSEFTDIASGPLQNAITSCVFKIFKKQKEISEQNISSNLRKIGEESLDSEQMKIDLLVYYMSKFLMENLNTEFGPLQKKLIDELSKGKTVGGTKNPVLKTSDLLRVFFETRLKKGDSKLQNYIRSQVGMGETFATVVLKTMAHMCIEKLVKCGMDKASIVNMMPTKHGLKDFANKSYAELLLAGGRRCERSDVFMIAGSSDEEKAENLIDKFVNFEFPNARFYNKMESYNVLLCRALTLQSAECVEEFKTLSSYLPDVAELMSKNKCV